MAEDLTTRILIEIRDELKATKHGLERRLDETNARLDETNVRLGVLARLTQGIDTRLTRMETQNAFVPRRVDALEAKVARIEERLGLEPI